MHVVAAERGGRPEAFGRWLREDVAKGRKGVAEAGIPLAP